MFGRRKTKDHAAAIDEFWRWWADARHQIAAGISDGTVASLSGELSEKVDAIHSDLQWELSKGRRAQHALVVAPAGNPALRAVVARWLAAAPATDAVFEYFGSRQPDDNVFTSRMKIADQELALDALRFAFTVDENAHELDVEVYHPGLADLPEGAGVQLTFLALDWALGEESAELWVGAVEPVLSEPPGARTFVELRAAVDELVAKHAEPVYAMLSGSNRKGIPVLAMIQVPLKSARWPRFDTHIAITARYPAQPNGLPTDESLTALRDLEDQVEAVLPPDGEVVAHETSDGVRTIHVYADGATPVRDAAAAVVASFTALKAKATITYDPGFEHVRHLRP